MRKLLVILGIPIDDLTMDEAVTRLDSFVTTGRATGKCHQVATVNADFVVNAMADPELRHILQQSDMATADGMPLVWGARLLGVPMSGRVTGADMVPALAARAAEKGYSIYLLDAQPGVAERAAQVLLERHPQLKISGIDAPEVNSVLDVDKGVIERVRAAKPDILLVAFGNPKQEKWISRYARELCVPLSIGVGGTLDFIAGETSRAPGWMQHVGLEWLYRLAREPRRLWKRYAHDLFYFGSFFAWQLWAMRTATVSPELIPAEDAVVLDQAAILNIAGWLNVGNRAEFMVRAEQALDANPFLIVNLEHAEFIDSSGLGALVALTNRARDAGGALWLVAVPARITNILALLKLDHFFDVADNIETALGNCANAEQPEAPSNNELEGWQVVKMPRAVDTPSAVALLENCTRRIDENPRVILDFSDTVFLSSKGLSTIISIDQISRAQGGELRVAGCSAEVLQGIRHIKLDTVVPLFRTVQAAASA